MIALLVLLCLYPAAEQPTPTPALTRCVQYCRPHVVLECSEERVVCSSTMGAP